VFDPTVDREPFVGLRRDLEQRLRLQTVEAELAATLQPDPPTAPAVTPAASAPVPMRPGPEVELGP
jgi:hypothetical protein